jgi:hypothetical protein
VPLSQAIILHRDGSGFNAASRAGAQKPPGRSSVGLGLDTLNRDKPSSPEGTMIRLALLFLLLTRGARKDRPSPGPEMLLASTTLANIASEFGSVIFYPTYGNVILGFSTNEL